MLNYVLYFILLLLLLLLLLHYSLLKYRQLQLIDSNSAYLHFLLAQR